MDANAQAPTRPNAGASSPGSAQQAETAPPERDAIRALEAAFDVIVQQAAADAGFADRLAAALAGIAPPKKRARTAAPPELLGLDLTAAVAEAGEIEVRDQLSGFTNAELAAYIREARIPSEPPSKLNKTQLLNAIIRSAG